MMRRSTVASLPLSVQWDTIRPAVRASLQITARPDTQSELDLLESLAQSRFINGHNEYGDTLFQKPTIELIGDAMEELADAAIYLATATLTE